jgi:hypothetical protein
VAGSIFLDDGRSWHSSSSAFFCALDTLASRATDPGLAAHLRELVDFNVGFLGVDELTKPQRSEFVGLLRQLPTIARSIPADEPYRDSFIDQMDSLARMA